MAVRWNKRQQNYCRNCGNTWYPRGTNRSRTCPHCKSSEVGLVGEGCITVLFFPILLPAYIIAPDHTCSWRATWPLDSVGDRPASFVARSVGRVAADR